MLITREGKEKTLSKDLNRLEFLQNSIRYTITPELSGGFRIHRNDGERITLHPGVRNEIIVK